jgi:transcriptional regulator with XRE-family HTH domain
MIVVNRQSCIEPGEGAEYDPGMQNLAERIRALREQAGLSQSQLASLSKVSQPTIHALEKGEQLSSRKLPQIARALGVTPADLSPDYGNEMPLDHIVFTERTIREAVEMVHTAGITRNKSAKEAADLIIAACVLSQSTPKR